MAWVQSEVQGQDWCQDQCVGLNLGDDGRVGVGGERCRKDGNGGERVDGRVEGVVKSGMAWADDRRDWS